MGKIVDIKAMEVLDSRGNPTVKAVVILDSSIKGSGIVPSGASIGQKEAIELRDNDKNRFQGKGVKIAVKNIHEKILPEIIGLDSKEQAFIDKIMIDIDGTKNKSKLGANAILAVSMAVCSASANEIGLPFYKYIGGCNARELPVPMMNIINGGVHADNNLDIQEFMIMPVGFGKFSDAMQAGVEIFHTLKSILKKNKLNISVGDEGGFAPNLNSNEDAILLILEAIERSGYKPGKDVFLALDVASSEFYKDGKYFFENKKITSSVLIEYYEKLINKYPVLSIEDGLSENDWKGWEEITKRLGKKVQLVGDDLFVTNPEILKEGIEKSVANSILIKLNQIGTITETLDTIEIAKKAGYTAIVSHRSGETEDTTIADLAVGCNTGFIKTGSLSRTDRIAKYNRLLEIEGELAELAVFRGLESFYNIKNITKSYQKNFKKIE